MNLKDVIKQIPQQPQTQNSLADQLRVLMGAANKLGLYDAADFLQVVADQTERRMMEVRNMEAKAA